MKLIGSISSNIIVGTLVIAVLPACQKQPENKVSKFEQRAQRDHNLAIAQYRRELHLADELGIASPNEDVEKEFAKIVKQSIVDDHKVSVGYPYPYSNYYVNLRSTKNNLDQYVKRLSQINPQLTEDIKNLVRRLDNILKQTHRAYYDDLMKEQRDIDMSVNMARMSGTVFDYAGAVFGKPRI